MNNKWLVRLIYVLSLATLILMVVVGYLAINNQSAINDLRRSIQQLQSESDITPINGKDGANGYTPIKNLDYFDGKNGANGKDSFSTHTETIITKEIPIPGKDGSNGAPGLQLELFVDVESCLLMTRYQGDTFWSIQAQLPKPCEVL